jgi:lysophospholipase L1-like esterase
VVQVVVVAVLLEGLVALLLQFPTRMPPLRDLARRYYGTFDRAILQMDPRFARYDPELTYTLRPGRFTFVQREFAHEFRINSLGVRDEEAALDGPEIVVLGDSIAMGWGVAQEETFAALLARATGRRVLNAAVSSYGTARELRLLERVDRGRLDWLVIQYNVNDAGENRVFGMQGNRQVARSREKFDDTSRRYASKRAYFPGKYAYESMRLLVRDVTHRIAPRTPRGPAPTPEEEADAFLNVLLHASTVDLERVRLVIVEVNGEDLPATLIPALRTRLADPALPAGVRRARLVDAGARLGPEHFHALDDHPNTHGHRAIADAVLAAMQSSP